MATKAMGEFPRCKGFGDREGKCAYAATTPARIWCQACEDKRWEQVRAPKFCDWFMGVYASPSNPQRSGMYVRTIRRTGRVMNPGVFYELTDGKGNFWQYPRDAIVRACGFCKGKPTQDAATWLDDKPRGPAPCPRCGKTYGPMHPWAETAA